MGKKDSSAPKDPLGPQRFNKDDYVDRYRTIYDVSWKVLISRNFVAGMSRSLGFWVFQIVFVVVVFGLFMQWLWPLISDFIYLLADTNESLETIINAMKFQVGSEAIQSGQLDTILKMFARTPSSSPTPTP